MTFPSSKMFLTMAGLSLPTTRTSDSTLSLFCVCPAIFLSLAEKLQKEYVNPELDVAYRWDNVMYSIHNNYNYYNDNEIYELHIISNWKHFAYYSKIFAYK